MWNDFFTLIVSECTVHLIEIALRINVKTLTWSIKTSQFLSIKRQQLLSINVQKSPRMLL